MKHFNHYSLIIASLSILIIFKSLHSQTVIVDGYAFLENQTVHDSIQIVFERTAPGQLFDTAYTDINGFYSKIIETGIYSITYSKDLYISYSLNDIAIYSNMGLTDIILETIGLNGSLSGTLIPGTYKVGGNITVEEYDTLIIEAGVNMKFIQDVYFMIHGLLIAEGTSSDSILFTRYENQISWQGINFWSEANSNSIISYATIEYSDNAGIRINESSPTISNSVIRYNSNDSYGSYGGGIKVSGSNSRLTNLEIYGNQATKGAGIYCEAVGEWGSKSVIHTVISNCLIYNNSGQNGSAIYFYSWYNLDQYPVLINSIVYNNISTIGGAIEGDQDYIPNVINNIICNNQGYGVYSVNGNIKYIGYNDLYGNLPGNFFNPPQWVGVNITVNTNNDSCDVYNNMLLEPQFIDEQNLNFNLQFTSPCIDAGLNDSVVSQTDFSGNIRIWDGNNDSIAIVDMGGYEYGSIPIPMITSTFTSPGNLCIFDTALIVYTGNASDTAYYHWDFDNGIIVNGIGQGPYEILWNESGEKTISLFVEENEMNSIITTKSVIVNPLPTVYAGQDTTILSGESYTISDAEAENYESLTWSTSGDGTFNNISFLNPVYSPGTVDIDIGNVTLTISANSTCGNDSDSITLSIDYLSLAGSLDAGNIEFIVYPTPVKTDVNIKFDKIQENLTIELFTISGKKVLSRQINNSTENLKIDVSLLENGIYLGKIQTNHQSCFFKILK